MSPSGGGVKETGAPGLWGVGGAHRGPVQGTLTMGCEEKLSLLRDMSPGGPPVHVSVLARDPRGAPRSRNWSQGTSLSAHCTPGLPIAQPGHLVGGLFLNEEPGMKHSLPD